MAERLQSLSRSLVSDQKSRLQQIRQRTQLDVSQFRNLIFGSGNYDKFISPIVEFIQNNKQIFTHHNIEDQNKEQQRLAGVKMGIAMREFLKLDIQKDKQKVICSFYALAAFDIGLAVKIYVGYTLYLKTLVAFQSNNKHKELIKKATDRQHIGCYCLTELHHGSYTKGMDTEAIYDHSTKTFILSTKGTKGMKWWIGALAEVANMSVVWAQMIIKGKSYGPQPFIVQVRDLKTHQVLPNIKIGDCGAKNGLNYIDNGYLILEDCRIPKENLLGKLGDIDQNGDYCSPVKSLDQKFGMHMSVLSQGRAYIAFSLLALPLNALTIALRYSCSRRQFENAKNQKENLIIDYPLTRNRLIPNLCQTIIHTIGSRHISGIYAENNTRLTDPSFKVASELHAISSSSKAKNSWCSAKTITECRAILGGHGYSNFSRLGSLYHQNDVSTTWEGDNNVLLQQVTKFLIKSIPKKYKGEVTDISFIHQTFDVDYAKIQENVRSLENVQLMFKHLFKQKYLAAQQKMTQLGQIYKDKNVVWDQLYAQNGNDISLFYCDLFYLDISKKLLSTLENQTNSKFLQNAIYVWAFSILEKEKYGTHDLRKRFQIQIEKLNDELVDGALVVCDAFNFSSNYIGSPFANYEGDGLQQYVNLLYTSKDTFRRPNYWEHIVSTRQIAAKK